MYGALAPDYNLISTVDTFTKKPKTELLPHGEKELLITHASMCAVYTMLEYDYLVMDKAAVEYLEEKY